MLSVTRDSSPGDSDSACSATNQKPDRQRRTRASKPKVRTGCITCKIRRVKCDEGKPACARCTSTGRHCDGYDSTASPSRGLTSPARAEEAQRGAEQARRQFLREYSGNAALQGLRPIVADIEGSEMERRFFHHFRSAAAGGFQASSASTAAGPFWTRVAPEMARRDGAVKHALIALGAAYRLFQQSSVDEYSLSAEGGTGAAPSIAIESPPRDNKIGTESPEELELFTIQQYNHSIALLQTHSSSTSLDSIRVTLVCCLAFIFLEMLRSKETAALTHLTNGLRILESVPREAFDSVTATSHTTGSDPHMDDIIRMFCRLECSATLFAANIRPSIALRSYHQTLSSSSSSSGGGGGDNQTASWLPPARSITDVHERCNRHACNVIARIYETREHYADATFWSDPHQRRQQEILCARSRSIREVVRAFAASEAAMGLEATDEYSLDLDLLHLLCMDMFAQAMTGLPCDDQDSSNDLSEYANIDPSLRSHPRHRYGPAGGSGNVASHRSTAGSGSRSQATLKEILGVASRLMETAASIRRGRQRQDRDQGVAGFTHEAGVLPPLYLVATIAEDSAVRQAALDLLKGAKVREGFWDGPSLYRLVLCVGDKVAQGRWPFHVVPSSLTGLGAIPDMWRLLERMDLDEDVR